MVGKRSLSSQTRNNWLIDALLLSSAVIASFSGLYFLFFPNGGYQGGRNPTYGMTLLFDRHSWGDIHRWGGVIMIAIVLIHLPLHWGWVKSMTRRIIRHLTGKSANLNARSRFNIFINLLVALSFFVTASSGLYFLFFPGGHGRALPDPAILFPRAIWNFIHTWGGVVLILAAVVHFMIHWKWIVKVTNSLFSQFYQAVPRFEGQQRAARR
jgi:hypothetical protein